MSSSLIYRAWLVLFFLPSHYEFGIVTLIGHYCCFNSFYLKHSFVNYIFIVGHVLVCRVISQYSEIFPPLIQRNVFALQGRRQLLNHDSS